MALRPVTREDYQFLYELLKEKTPEQNISHKEMPTYEQHVAFNDAKPYKEDYVIDIDGNPAGRIYLTNRNEVGIHIKESFRHTGLAQKALSVLIGLHPGEAIYANIAPGNHRSKRFFTNMGFRLIQETYKLGD